MAFIDEIKFKARAGRGGDGVVRWLHEKFREYGGPSGGDGGKGGDVYAVATRDIGLLSRYRQVKLFEAERGGDGGNRTRHGKNGKDLEIVFPIGSVITNLSTKRQYELLEEGEKFLLLAGGRGGKGNEHFKSSTNVRPKKATAGMAGETADFYIELRLFADAGIIGLPNAGKTTLLNALTEAGAKVGDYPFTTLEPNLGSFFGFILADIPGLIEGASEGKGLGHKFLRHIRRTRLLIHCVSVESPDILSDYRSIRAELGRYDEELSRKDELVVLTKSDAVSAETAERAKKALKKENGNIAVVSAIDGLSVKKLGEKMLKLLNH